MACSARRTWLGVTFRFGVDIRGLRRASGKVTAVETGTGDIAGALFYPRLPAQAARACRASAAQ